MYENLLQDWCFLPERRGGGDEEGDSEGSETLSGKITYLTIQYVSNNRGLLRFESLSFFDLN